MHFCYVLTTAPFCNLKEPDTSGHPQPTVRPSWIRLVVGYPTSAQSDWDLGNLEAMLMPWAFCHIPQVITEHFLTCNSIWAVLSMSGGIDMNARA